MTIKLITGVAVAALLCAGCDNGKKNGAADKAGTPASANAPAAPVPAPADPKEVMVTVGDKKLTRGELDAEVEKIINGQLANVPPEHRSKISKEEIEYAKTRMRRQIAETFVQKTVLLKEADAKKISVSDEEMKKQREDFMKNVSAHAAPGKKAKTFEEFAADYPLGKDRFMEEFKDKARIDKLIDQEVKDKIKVDPEALKAEYASIVSNITKRAQAPQPEKVQASHILIKTGNGKTDDAAKKEIDALHAQLKGLSGDALKAKFAEIAKEKSDCPSKAKGGDLGEFGHGQMVTEFDKAAFGLKVGALSEPVKTQFGWHLILKTKALPAKTPTAADVEKTVAEQKPKLADVENGMKERQFQQQLRAYIEGLQEKGNVTRPGFPQPPARPKKSIESKPVELKAAPKKAAPAPAQAKAATAKAAPAPAKAAK